MSDHAQSDSAVRPRARGTSAFTRFLPVIFFEFHLTGSLAAFLLGPLQPQMADSGLLIGYALVGQLVILFGYCLGASWPARGYRGSLPRGLVLCASIVITLALLPPTFGSRNYAEVSVVEAIVDPGSVYEVVLNDYRNPDGIRALSIVRGLVGPLLGLLLPLGILFWSEIRLPWRILWLAAVAGKLAIGLISGSAFYLFDIVLVVPWFLWLRFFVRPGPRPTADGGQEPRGSHSAARRAVFGVACLAIVVVGLWYFSHSRLSRFRPIGKEYPGGTVGWSKELYGVSLPESFEFGAFYVMRYWSLGYYGLAGCLDLPFEWSGGLGHSLFLSRYAARLDADMEWIERRAYPSRLERRTGYRADLYWHTIYPWLASDLTFAGAWVFMGFMAYLLAGAWSDSLLRRNPFALGFLGQLLLMFYYVPANNMRLSNPEVAMTFWGLLALWLVTRGRPLAG